LQKSLRKVNDSGPTARFFRDGMLMLRSHSFSVKLAPNPCTKRCCRASADCVSRRAIECSLPLTTTRLERTE
jgi:hypothetical protein